MTTMEQLMAAMLNAPEDRKAAALRVLKGDPGPEEDTVHDKGPLFLGMGAGAKLLGVSRATFWRIVSSGRIERVELYPSSYRVRRADVEALALRPAQGKRTDSTGPGNVKRVT